MTLDNAKEILRSIEQDLIILYPHHISMGGDVRLGNETYGYRDDESILGNLCYISDRWCAAFRIAWMLGIINEEYRGYRWDASGKLIEPCAEVRDIRRE